MKISRTLKLTGYGRADAIAGQYGLKTPDVQRLKIGETITVPAEAGEALINAGLAVEIQKVKGETDGA